MHQLAFLPGLILLFFGVPVFSWLTSLRSNGVKITSLNIIGKKQSISRRSFGSSSLRFKVAADDEVELAEQEAIVFEKFDGGSFARKLSSGAVPIAASLGFAVTRSPTVAARIAGAALGGVAGFVLQKVIENKLSVTVETPIQDVGGNGGKAISTEVLSALKTLSIMPPRGLSLSMIEKVAKKSKVPEASLPELFTHLFASVIYNTVRVNDADFLSLMEILELATLLNLTPAEIGDGFTLAVARIGHEFPKDYEGFFDDSLAPSNLLLQTSKALFIGEKLIGNLDGYYGKRFMVALSIFPPSKYRDVITDACTQLFKRLVETIILNPSQFTVEEVTRMREFLTSKTSEINGFRHADMQNLILQALQYSLDTQLDIPSEYSVVRKRRRRREPEDTKTISARYLTAKVMDPNNLRKIQQVLGWSSTEFSKTVETKTLPVFEKAAEIIVKEVMDEPSRADEYVDVMKERVESLCIPSDKARSTLINIVSKKNQEYLDLMRQVYDRADGKLAPVYKIMTKYSMQHDAIEKLLAVVSPDSSLPIPGLQFSKSVRESLLKIQLKSGVDKVPEDMFNMTTDQIQLLKRTISIPKVLSWIRQCISESNFEEGAKAAYKKMLAKDEVTELEWAATSTEFFYIEVRKIAESRQVPSEEDSQRLEKLKSFLDVPDGLASKVILEFFGDKFVKAITECMMPTGVLTEEYLEGLERLRRRLRLSKADADNLLGFAIRQRVVPIVTDLFEQFQIAIGVKRPPADEYAKDKSRDPISSRDNVLGFMEMSSQKKGGGPNVFMREALNLIDFIESNYQIWGVDVNQQSLLPVTAAGIVNSTDLLDMYTHYVITRVTEQDSALKQRYVQNEVKFARVLGIAEEDIMATKITLANTAYKNMLQNIFRSNGVVGPQDLQQFATLRVELGIDEESGATILNDASISSVLSHAKKVFKRKKGDAAISPAEVQRFREQVMYYIYIHNSADSCADKCIM